MDHASAHVIELADPMTTTVVECDCSHEEKEKTFQKGETMMQNKNQQQQAKYYKKLGESIIDFEDVVLFGPTNVKGELLNIFKSRHALR